MSIYRKVVFCEKQHEKNAKSRLKVRLKAVGNAVDQNKIFLVGFFFIACISLYNISELKVPSIIWDEIGYWASGALFNGENWQGITSMTSYYSYGYGILLGVLIRIVRDPVSIYKAAIILNVVFLEISYSISYKLYEELFSGTGWNAVLISVLSVSYPSMLMNSQIAWTECILAFLFWMLAYFLLKIIKTGATGYLLGFAGLLVYLYAVHQRSLGALAAGIILIAIFAGTKKINKRQLLLFFLAVGIFLGISFILKGYVKNQLWGLNAELVAINDFQGQIDKFRLLLSATGIQLFIESIIGKIYYLVASTYGVIVWAVLFCFKNLKKLKQHACRYAGYLSLFLLLSFFLSLGISALFMIYPIRIDTLIYGRYTEWIIGPFLMIGLGYIAGRKRDISIWWMILGALMISTLYLSYIYDKGNLVEFLHSCVPAMAIFFDSFGKDTGFILPVALCFSCVVLIFMNLIKSNNKYIERAALFFLLSCFLINGLYARRVIMKIQRDNNQAVDLADVITDIGIEASIYCIKGEHKYTYMHAGIVQYLLPDYEIHIVLQDEIPYQEDVILLVELDSAFDDSDYEKVMENSGWNMMVLRDGQIYQKIRRKQYSRAE